MLNSNPVILLTGEARVGKTTAIQKIIPLLSIEAGGFYSPEIQENGERIAFEIITLEGNSALISTKKADVIFNNEIRVGNHRVNIEVIESIIVPALLNSLNKKNLIIIDEIGPMEITSAKFRDATLKILNSDSIVVGTMVELSTPFVNQIKALPRVKLKKVSLENRDKIPEEVLSELQSYILK